MTTQLLEKLISIPSFSREEAAAADYLYSRLWGEGLNPHRKGNNIWCECGSGSSTVLLNAHIDTVKPCGGWTLNPFDPVLEGDKLFGLGSNDDGGSLIALLEAFKALSQKQLPYRLVFSATAEEEVSGTGGLEQLFPEIGPIDYAIIGEPTGMQMGIAERGLMVLDCTAKGVGGHAAHPDCAVNAIYKALEDIEIIRSIKFDKVSLLLGPVGINVTQINAGSAHNVIPAECSFVVDVRSNGLYSNKELLEAISGAVSCEVKARSTRLESSNIAPEHPLVQKGKELGLETFGSATLSNCAICPFPAVKMGPGDTCRSHKADEYILLSEISAAIDIYIKLLTP